MTTFVKSIRRAVRRASHTPGPTGHFHVDGFGRAYACHSRRCQSPGLTLREARISEMGTMRQVW